MTEIQPSKPSAGRRRGDAYELHLLALKCLKMVVDPHILRVFHEYRPALPADDVVVESTGRIDCYQAKHAGDPHALLTFNDLTDADSELRLNVQRLRLAWDGLKVSGKDVRLHFYTNRAADSELAKILDGDRIAPDVLDDTKQCRRRSKLKRASGIEDESEFEAFLSSLRFDLRQYDVDGMAEHIRDEWLERRLGLDSPDVFLTFIYQVERWFLEQRSRPIEKGEILRALRVDGATLPQNFPVDRRTYVHRPVFKRQIDALVESATGGYVAVVGPPGSGKGEARGAAVAPRAHRSLLRRPVGRVRSFLCPASPVRSLSKAPLPRERGRPA